MTDVDVLQWPWDFISAMGIAIIAICWAERKQRKIDQRDTQATRDRIRSDEYARQVKGP